VGANPLTALIGTDVELAATLLQECVVSTDMLLGAMLGQRGAMLESLGPLLIRGGVTSEQIAATGNWDTTYWGSESSVNQKRLDYFTELSKRDDSDSAQSAELASSSNRNLSIRLSRRQPQPSNGEAKKDLHSRLDR
jgi:hypothetical protein